MSNSQFDNKLSAPSLAFQPLYLQVADYVKQLIVERRWLPGEVLPSEFKLADEFRVSQGTVRKALNLLTDEKIVSRRQGVGTFVSEHTAQDALFRFFPLQQDDGSAQLPKAKRLSCEQQSANKTVRKALQLEKGEKVVKVVRLRLLDDDPCIIEVIYLPLKHFPNVDKLQNMPHTLYHFYQTQFNQTVQKTNDSVKAMLADEKDAQALNVNAGTPLLFVTRVTRSIDGKLIEYRESKCKTDHYHYQIELD